PWEFEELTPREFELMVDGYKTRQKNLDARAALFTCYQVNAQRDKNSQIKVADIMQQLWPMTALEREIEAIKFMREFNAEAEAAKEGETHSNSKY
ncbi:MAG: hypothetical protein E6672_07795, partial [Negativicoccus succinicivorans]|nr:hypothetical protein [Negativicoccus succinicivorans]